MFNSTRFKTFRKMFSVVVIASFAVAPLALAHDEHGKSDAAGEKTVTGEIVDMMCYVDHSAMGEGHGQSCGSKCIKNGGPVGIVENGKAYLVVGEHKPMNDELADSCGKTITLKGKLAERGGIAMIENAEVVKK
jgi:hypothetical protein